MTLDEFIKIREEIRDTLCDFDDERGTLRHKIFPEKTMDYKLSVNDNLNEHNLLVALNALTGVLDKCSPIEYELTKAFYENLTVLRHYGTISQDEKRPFVNKLYDIRDYLGGDFEVPKKFFVNQIELSKNDPYGALFLLDNPVTEQIFSDIEKLLADKAIEISKSVPYQEEMILGRIMSKEEYEKFENDGMVSNLGYDGIRRWEGNDNIGNSGDYCFMKFQTEEDVLMNINSVIPYIRTKKDADYFVMFRAKHVPCDDCYSSMYDGEQAYSQEIALPFYDKDNFEILSCNKMDNGIPYTEILETLKKSNILTNFSADELQSNFFDETEKEMPLTDLLSDEDIEELNKNIDASMKNNKNSFTRERIEQKLTIDKIISKFQARLVDYCENIPVKKIAEVTSDNLATEMFKYAKLIQNKYNLSDGAAYQVAAMAHKFVNYRAKLPFTHQYTISSNVSLLYDEDWNEDYEDNSKMEILYRDHSGKIKYSTVCEYDDNRNLIKQSTYNEDKSLKGYCLYEYNKNGVDKKTEFYNPNGDMEYVETFNTNKNDNIRTWTDYDSNGNVLSSIETKYDNNNNELYYKSYDSAGNITSWHEHEYDTEGNLTKKTDYFPDGSVKSSKEIEYDIRDRKIRETLYGRNNIVKANTVYEYPNPAPAKTQQVQKQVER